MDRVFLGGTSSDESTWREEFIPLLEIDFRNPPTRAPNESPGEKDLKELKNNCDIHLYVLTSDMKDSYPFAELMESAIDRRNITILHIIPDGCTDQQMTSMKRLMLSVKEKGTITEIVGGLSEVAKVINLFK